MARALQRCVSGQISPDGLRHAEFLLHSLAHNGGLWQLLEAGIVNLSSGSVGTMLTSEHGIRHAASAGRQRVQRADSYRTRILTSLAASILLVSLAIRLPYRSEVRRVGWTAPIQPSLIELERARPPKGSERAGVSTTFALPESPETHDDEEGDGEEDELIAQSEPMIETRRMQARQTIYDHVESPPAIRGGLGAYYINIEYPPEAVERGIEGRLMLRFVVDTEGRATDIVVYKSLHPLCDSAAVHALRETRFVPGKQNGKKVPVRMHLPVRFRLVPSRFGLARADSV